MKDDNWINTAEDLEKIFDTLNIERVLERSLNYLSTKVDCHNIHWLSQDEWKAICQSQGPYRPQSSISRMVKIHSQATVCGGDSSFFFIARRFF